MRKPSHIFNDAARQRINAAVAAAESRTSAEIVPVVTGSSGRYDRAEDMAGFFVALVLLVAAWLFFQRVENAAATWDAPSLRLNLPAIVLILAGGYFIGAILCSQVGWIRRLFAPRAERATEVELRARQAFFDQRIHHARSSSGLLLYVSLFERRAAVIADETVIEKLGQPAIEALCAQLTTLLHEGDMVAALERTITRAGEQLVAVLPRQADDTNELPDALVLVD